MHCSRAVCLTVLSILALLCGSDVRPGGAQSPPGDGTAPPTVAITVPTLDPAYRSTATAISLGGVAGGEIVLAQVSWTNDRGGRGIASGVTRWWVPEIVLQPGRNVITVTARDKSGKMGTATLAVVSVVPPRLTVSILYPASAVTARTTLSTINLSGSASDPVGVAEVTWANARGGQGRAEGTTSWSARGIPLRPGLNELIVTARGVTGATATASLLVTCDAAAPPIRIGGGGEPFAAPRS